MERNKRYSLLLLSGGKSNRMGADKAALLYEGKSFLEHMLDKAGRLGIDKFYIAGGSSPRSDVQAVADIYPDRGPLGGLHAGMLAMDSPYCLVLPVDAPTLPAEILEELLCEHEKRPGEKVLIWEHGVRQEPLIAVYPTAMVPHIEELIRESGASVMRCIEGWGYESLRRELAEEGPININTPELYKRLLGEEVDSVPVKETILLRRIQNGEILPVKDEVALEKTVTIHLHRGGTVEAVCSPDHTEEFTLGQRYLLDDLSPREYPPQPADRLEAMALENVFRVIGELFESPGELFRSTGCAHSCALFCDGAVHCHFEDIGRHNALDKVIGYALKNGIPIGKSVVFSSGRISEDYLRKVIRAGFPMVVSRAAVTAAAVALARRENITMLGFIRRGSGNIYHIGDVDLI